MISIKCYIFLYSLLISSLSADIEPIYENILSESLLEALEAKSGKLKYEHAFDIGERIGDCLMKKREGMPNQPSCLSSTAYHILFVKNNASEELFIQVPDDFTNFTTTLSSNLNYLISFMQRLDKIPEDGSSEAMKQACMFVNPKEMLESMHHKLKVEDYFYAQSLAYEHDVRPYRLLKNAWNYYVLEFTAFSGICNVVGDFKQSISKDIREFDQLIEIQGNRRQDTYFQTMVKDLVNDTFYDKEVLLEDLRDLRNELNERYEDMNLFDVFSIPGGNILIPSTTRSDSYLFYKNSKEVYIIVYRTLPANTYTHVRFTDPALLNFNYNTVGPLFGKGPYCNLNPNGSLVLTKFYEDIRDSCNERLACMLFESSNFEAATTNANVFLRNSIVDCGWFSSKDLFLLARNTPKNDEFYEKEDKHYVNIYLGAHTRLHSTVFNVSNPIWYDDNKILKL